MLEGYIKPVFAATDSHIWRAKHCWTEEADLALKRQYRTAQKLFDKYSGKYAMPGAQKFMSPVEFTELIEQSGIVNDFFTFKEILPVWNLSMMTQKDEINSDKHLNMNFSEFTEAVCRIAFKLSVPHILDDEVPDDDPYSDIEKVREWGNRTFGYKLESFLLLCA
jgi:hypothetical protein